MLILLVISFLINMASSSIVMDEYSQNYIQMSDYCPKFASCPQGSHVMCMYYNPKRIMGPRCSNAQNISITPELAKKFIDVSNAIRSKIAIGKERGLEGVLLPRGYGIFRLNWDKELATFAQVLANQCVLKHDLCRATKRFSDPGQTAGLVRFTYPDWYPVYKEGLFTTPGLSSAKVLYAITQTMKSWYGQKSFVNAAMISEYPDWTLNPNNQGGRLYLEMVYGPATHMGCGISAYTDYAYYDNYAALNYNSVQIVCNFSARPRKGEAVYETSPPDSGGCGCPEGSVEDEDCLCNFHDEHQLKLVTNTCSGKSCEPTVVLLPIFTVEDAPPQKLMAIHNTTMNTGSDPLDIFNILEGNKDNVLQKEENRNLQMPVEHNLPHKDNINKSIGRQALDIQKRYFSKKTDIVKTAHSKTINKKHNIFAKVPKFVMPTKKSVKTSMKQNKINDVLPRKSFTKAKNLVKSYLKTGIINDKEKDVNPVEKEIITRDHLDYLPTEMYLNSVEEKILGHDDIEHQNISFNYQIDLKTVDENNKLMTLLDYLEREVQNVELDGTGKQLLDAKIRKIYGKVVNKPVKNVGNDKQIRIEDPIPKLGYQKHFSSPDEVLDNNKIIINTAHSFKTDLNSNRMLERKQDSLNFEKYYNINKELSRPNLRQDPSLDYDIGFDNPNKQNDYTIGHPKRIVYRNDINYDFNPRKNIVEDINEKRSYNVNYDDPLGNERRRFYQNKLDDLERRLRNSKGYRRRKESLSVRPTAGMQTRALRYNSHPSYMQQGARYSHPY